MKTLKSMEIKDKYKIELIEDEYGAYFIVYSEFGQKKTSNEISSLNLAFELYDKMILKRDRLLN